MVEPISLPRFSKGKRPSFFADGASDHLLAMILELATELAAVHSANLRLEQLLVAAGVTTQAVLDEFELSPEALRRHDEWTDLLLGRLYSSVLQQSRMNAAKDV